MAKGKLFGVREDGLNLEEIMPQEELDLMLSRKLSVSSYLNEKEIDEIMGGTYVEVGGDEHQTVIGEPIDLQTLEGIFK